MLTPNSILIIGNFSTGALEHQFVKHLKALHWQVFTFDIQDPVNLLRNRSFFTKGLFKISPNSFYKASNEELLNFVKKTRPTVTLVFKGMEIFPETLKEIKTHTKLLCNYNPDHPYQFYSKGSGNKNVKESIPIFDLYGTYALSIAKGLKEKFAVDSFVLPFGFDDTLRLETKQNSSNFSFIGAYDKERLNILNQLQAFPINVYGDEKWKKKLKQKGNLKIPSKSIFNEAYANECQNSVGIFNFLRLQNIIESSHNMRTFEVPGYGGLLISNRTEEQQSFFEEGKEAIFFENSDELKEKLKFLTENPAVIERIKTNAYQRAKTSGYSYAHRIKEMDALFSKHIHYRWLIKHQLSPTKHGA